jgi:oxygen-independent coproporphyrinogen-3 oxidase
MVTAIDRCFAVAADARRSVELDPRQTTSQQIEALVDLGFASLSVGVQDFAGPVQDAIHRHQSRVQTAWLIDYARNRGFRDVNVDIVYGLPLQTEKSFATTLDAILQLAPDRIALFGYAHLPSKLPHQQLVERAGRVLDPRERAELLLLGIERLTAAGYLHLGLDHFARPGSALARAATEHRMVRTFQGYVEHRADTVLGLGVSSISSTRRMFWQNHTELAAWQSAVAEHQLPIARGRVLDRDDQIRRVVIGKLMCEGAVELAAIEHDLDIVAAQYFADELAELAAMPELAAYDAGANAVSTTPLGRLLVRNVCQVFDRYRHAGDAPRYSSTI